MTLHSLPSSSAFRFSSLLRRYIIGVQLIMGGGIDPSPTSDLRVSGNRLRVNLLQNAFSVRLHSQNDGDEDDTAENSQEPEDRSPTKRSRKDSTEHRPNWEQ